MSSEIDALRPRMQGAMSNLEKEFGGLRTGRASADLLNPVMVDAYGSKVPLNQVANVSAADARTLTVQIWDGSQVKAVEKGIIDSGLGLSPNTEGQTIRINLPELNSERREELVKVARKYAEETKVAVRNVRRDGMDALKKEKDAGTATEDDVKIISDQIQKLTDEFVAKVDTMLSKKESDIRSV